MGKLEKRQERTKSCRKDILSDYQVLSKDQCGNEQEDKIYICPADCWPSADLPTLPFIPVGSQDPNSHQLVNFVQGYYMSVHSDSVKCTKFAAREYSALIPAGGPPLPTLG